ncbi:1135_t:CDS:1 [Paraglomus occultum]|uniref:1135_t:CDS:1 n=1 Tax=Paraglomus occultum TaxID=144539 RepID=A0A9N9BLU4_9GLOM|nr:1135_t:CDS:1 [Paraglomus occultum]
MAPSSAFVTHMLQNPVPTYLLGTLPAILTIGAAPFSSLKLKVSHIFICLASPFVGLFYFVNINFGEDGDDQDVVDACVYWLNCNRFEGGIWPFGYRVQAIDARPNNQNVPLPKALRSCIANASVLDRFASLASAYYIVVGIALGIYRAAGPCDIQEWPYIPLLLTWTLPAILIRIFKGKIVAKNPEEELNEDMLISVRKLSNENVRSIRENVLSILVLSSLIPWVAVIIAYLTRPKGFGCRSKYLTGFCSVWTFNSIVAFVYYYLGNRPPPGVNTDQDRVYIWFQVCGFVVAVFLVILAVLSNNPSYWVNMFGDACDTSACFT